MAERTDRTGEVFVNNKGYEIIIVEYNRNDDLWVEFQDEYKARVHTEYKHCKNGEVKNPYHPSIYGVGCLGLMSDGSKPKTIEKGKRSREYILWRSMIQRCYDEKYHERQPTYKDCEVCDRWLVFTNFLEDLPLIENYELWRDNPNKRIALDKDIKVQGNKVYSLETCKFVSQSENSKDSNFRSGIYSPKKVMAISLTENKVLIFQSMLQADKFGFNSSHICKCCQGERKSHKGYKWKII